MSSTLPRSLLLNWDLSQFTTILFSHPSCLVNSVWNLRIEPNLYISSAGSPCGFCARFPSDAVGAVGCFQIKITPCLLEHSWVFELPWSNSTVPSKEGEQSVGEQILSLWNGLNESFWQFTCFFPEIECIVYKQELFVYKVRILQWQR